MLILEVVGISIEQSFTCYDKIDESISALSSAHNEYMFYYKDFSGLGNCKAHYERIDRLVSSLIGKLVEIKENLKLLFLVMYNNQVEKRLSEIGELKKDYNSLCNELALKYKDRFDEMLLSGQRTYNYLVSMSDKASNYLSQKQTQVERLVESTAHGVMAGDYIESAANEMKRADWSRRLSVSLMLLAVMVLTYTVYMSVSEEITIQQLISKMMVAIMISIPAGYLARESSRHREQQYLLQQTSLHLRAIHPFLETLPELEQHKIKSELARQIFKSSDSKPSPSDTSPVDYASLLSQLIKNISSTKKLND